jgi:small subunit ribosomal protein S9
MIDEKKFYEGVGKRKTSIAKVFLKETNSESILITVNNKSFDSFFSGLNIEKELIKTPLILLNLKNKYDIDIKVQGGGITGQLESIKLAISKALANGNKEYRPLLKQNLLLRRDARIKERRKYGLKKARKASQYSKR